MHIKCHFFLSNVWQQLTLFLLLLFCRLSQYHVSCFHNMSVCYKAAIYFGNCMPQLKKILYVFFPTSLMTPEFLFCFCSVACCPNSSCLVTIITSPYCFASYTNLIDKFLKFCNIDCVHKQLISRILISELSLNVTAWFGH